MGESRINRNVTLAKEASDTLLQLELRIRFERIDERMTRMEQDVEDVRRVFFGDERSAAVGYPEWRRRVEGKLLGAQKSGTFVVQAIVGAIVAGLVSLFFSGWGRTGKEMDHLKEQVKQLEQQLKAPAPWPDWPAR